MQSDDGYSHTVTFENEHARVVRVQIPPGQKTELHAHRHPYVLVPHQSTTVRKTTYRNGQVVDTQEFEHKAGEPYFVGASDDGSSFTFENIGTGHVLCDKTFIKK